MGSVQPSGTCIAAVSVVAAGDPFTNITADDAASFGAGCALVPYPAPGVPVHLTSTVCDASVCCNTTQPNCPINTPGRDVSTWVKAARIKLGAAITWSLLNNNDGSSGTATSCDNDPSVCTVAVATRNANAFPSSHEHAMVQFLASHVSDAGCWDKGLETL